MSKYLKDGVPTVACVKLGIPLLVAVILFFMAIYTVPEGHVGIVKRFSEAKEQVDPGLHIKIPFVDSVEEMEMRMRKNEEKMGSSTSEQMPATVIATVNWTVDKSAALDLYRNYGGLDQFESRVLDTRFRAAVKAKIPKYTAEKLIQDRSQAVTDIHDMLVKKMIDFPVTINSVQIENVGLPPIYLQSIQTKQTEKNLADAEDHKLRRQGLEAQQLTNTEKAKADGINFVAAAEANAIRIKGLAEADAITAKSKALGKNQLLVKLTEAQRWDGRLPSTMMGAGAVPIMDIRSK